MGYTSEWTVILDTNAGHLANPKIYRPPYCLVPTDTADAGKHKLCNGVDHYSALPFIEDSAFGGMTELTGHVTAGPGTGSQVATIPANTIATAMIQNDAVSYAKQGNVAADSLVGNPTGALANPTNVGLGSGVAFDAGVLVGQTIYLDAVTPAPGAILVPFTGQTAGGNGQATIYLTDDGLVTGNLVFSSIIDLVSCRPFGGTTVNPLAMFGAQLGLLAGADPADPVTVQVWRGVNPVVDGTLQPAIDGTEVQIWVAGIPA